jgi:hypothetical protein
MDKPTKITFAEMRDMGVRGVLIYCADYRCSHSIALSADQWTDDLRLSDIEPRFVCQAGGKRGADVRPDFNWDKPGALTIERPFRKIFVCVFGRRYRLAADARMIAAGSASHGSKCRPAMDLGLVSGTINRWRSQML